MENNSGPVSTYRLGAAVQATEAIRYSVLRNSMDLLLEHIRPDDSSVEVRKAAIQAFRDIATPCLKQNKDGVIEIGNDQAGQTQFCLVYLRRWEGAVDEVLAFITRCADRAEATDRLKALRNLEG